MGDAGHHAPETKREVRRPSCSEDMADFWSRKNSRFPLVVLLIAAVCLFRSIISERKIV